MKVITTILLFVLTVYGGVCALLYFSQEKLLFYPEKLGKDFEFTFSGQTEELTIKANDGILLSGLLFKVPDSKGLIFYLHGNGGSIASWGEVAQLYNSLNYDVFILDYRGYGKSGGRITSQRQLFDDVQSAYNVMKLRYAENKINVFGYSIGTGLAARVASANNPHLLVLHAPYYSMADLMQRKYPGVPAFILKYQLRTDLYLKKCKMPIAIFHGDDDEIIYYGSSVKLKKLLKKTDLLITLRGQGHNGITNNGDYQLQIGKILGKAN